MVEEARRENKRKVERERGTKKGVGAKIREGRDGHVGGEEGAIGSCKGVCPHNPPGGLGSGILELCSRDEDGLVLPIWKREEERQWVEG